MSGALAAVIQNLSLQTSCAHCGKEGAALHRCSRCKQAWYCGAECQNAAWKKHKKTCAPPLSLDDVRAQMQVSGAARDWREMLKWEGRMDEMMEGESDASCKLTLIHFQAAHALGHASTGSLEHMRSMIPLQERHVDLLGKMERFRDQGEEMCALAISLLDADRREEAGAWYHKARQLGVAHGFFSVECRTCMGLGGLAMDEGRHEEGLDLLRNALAALPLSENEGNLWEIPVLHSLIEALFETNAIDELEPLLQRYQEAAQAESAEEGRMCVLELRSLSFRARLHEARGRPHEAAREVRALLDLLSENQATVQDKAGRFRAFLDEVCSHLKVLDPEVGEQELVKSVAASRAKLR